VSEPTFVLDSDVLIPLFNHVGPDLAGLGRLPVIVPELIWGEVGSGRRGPNRAEFMTAIAGGPTAWDVAAPEHAAFLRLYAGVEASLGDGERAAIAYAFVHPPAVFVSGDMRALRRAVEHLRGRTLSIFGLLDNLVSAGRVPKDVFDTFARRYAATELGKQHPVPLWV
jgi:hypothetical protein